MEPETISKTGAKPKSQKKDLKHNTMYLLKNIVKISLVCLLCSNYACKNESDNKLKKITDKKLEKTTSRIKKENHDVLETSKKIKKVATDSTVTIENEIQKITIILDSINPKQIIEGRINGSEIRDYLFNINKGQHLKFKLVASSKTIPYFNLMAPGEAYIAFYNGSINNNVYEGVANKSGTFTARVYLMRSAARRNENGKFQLEVFIK
jgi:hypothetical protein